MVPYGVGPQYWKAYVNGNPPPSGICVEARKSRIASYYDPGYWRGLEPLPREATVGHTFSPGDAWLEARKNKDSLPHNVASEPSSLARIRIVSPFDPPFCHGKPEVKRWLDAIPFRSFNQSLKHELSSLNAIYYDHGPISSFHTPCSEPPSGLRSNCANMLSRVPHPSAIIGSTQANTYEAHFRKGNYTDIRGIATGPIPQPLRAIPGYPSQQAPQNRTAQLGSARLQSGKIGNGSSWGFGSPVNGAPGLTNVQPRTAGAATSSFAHTIGGSQPATPLDLNEFPSLGGAAQPQFQNPGQAIWANANQRATQQTPVQRPQQQQSIHSQAINQNQQTSQHHQDPSHHTNDDLFPTASQFASGLEDYRHGGQSGIGQLSGSNQPQTGDIDEFPPLGRNESGEIGQDRRSSLMQNAAFGGYSNGSTFAQTSTQLQNRHNISNGHHDVTRPSTIGDRMLSPAGLGTRAASNTRSPAESLRQGQSILSEQDPNSVLRNNQNGNNSSLLSAFPESQTAKPENSQQHQAPQAQLPQSRVQQQTGFGGDLTDSPGAVQTPDQMPLSQMSEIDRYGLPGLLATIKNENQDLASLAIGQDLTQLGLDLNSAEPLFPTFASPFADSPSRPLQPDFQLPQCYHVSNVHKLDTKVPSFSDETLFYIFYTMPRDLMQEIAAIELTNRNWRYHKGHQLWLTKDGNFNDPISLSPESEKGSYIFFEPQIWQRVRRDVILVYSDLDNHISPPRNGAPIL